MFKASVLAGSAEKEAAKSFGIDQVKFERLLIVGPDEPTGGTVEETEHFLIKNLAVKKT